MIKKELISIIERKDRNILLFSFLLKRTKDINNGSDIFNQLWNLLEMNCDFFSVKLSDSEIYLYLGYYINFNLDLSLEIKNIISNLVSTVFPIIPDYITIQPIKNDLIHIGLSHSDQSLNGLIGRDLKYKYISISSLSINKNITAILKDLSGIRGLTIAIGVEIANEKIEYSLIMELTSNSESEQKKIEKNLLEYFTSNNFINGTIKIITNKTIRSRPIQTNLGICDQKLEMASMISILHSIVHLINVDCSEVAETIVPRHWLGFIHKSVSNQEIPEKDIVSEAPISTENQLISTNDVQDTPHRSLNLTQEELEERLFLFLNDVEFTRLPSCSESNNLICLLVNSIHFEFLLVTNFNLVDPELLIRENDYLNEEKLFFIITGDSRLEEEYNTLNNIIFISDIKNKLVL